MAVRVTIKFIRVDHKLNIFNAENPVVAIVHNDAAVWDVLLQIRAEDEPLRRLRMGDIKVYKLITPIPALKSNVQPRQTRNSNKQFSGTLKMLGRSAETRGTSGESDETSNAEGIGTRTSNLIPNTFEALQKQIKLSGLDTHLLQLLTHAYSVSSFEPCGDHYINAIIYHAPIPEDCGFVIAFFLLCLIVLSLITRTDQNVPGNVPTQMDPIPEEKTFEVARKPF